MDIWRSYRKCLFDPELPIFIHLPKNGGVQVSNSLYGHKILHIPANDIHDAFPKFYNARKKIAFYRDPIDRFLSAANFVRTGGTKTQGVDLRSYYITADLNDIQSHIDFLAYPESDLDYVYWSQSRFLRDDVTLYDIATISAISADYGGCEKERANQSSKFFTQNDLTDRQTAQLRKHYAEDFKLAVRICDYMPFNRAAGQ